MKIIFHGAVREVGKSCFELITDGKRYLMDAGVKFTSMGAEYPKYLDNITKIDGIFLSHAHLDHSGALPMLENKNLNCPIFCTDLTWKISNVLLRDTYHIEKLKHLHPAYLERDIRAVEKDVVYVKYEKWYDTKDKKIKFAYHNAGHIPGSASILFELEGKRVLYTGDLNTEAGLLMMPSVVDTIRDVDVLITESTYAERPHPDRKDCEVELLQTVRSTIEHGGSVLIPVFSVGRSQEIIMILSKLDVSIPIYLDGMAREVTEIILVSNDPFVANRDILEEMAKRVIFIKNPRDRERIAHKKGIVIVSTSGMVQGGPVVGYMEKMLASPNNSILFTGFQASGTRGRSVLEDHIFYNNGRKSKVKAHVRKFDFSAHIGQDRLHSLITRINPKNLVIVHGDLEAGVVLKKFASEIIEGNVYLPYEGQEIDF